MIFLLDIGFLPVSPFDILDILIVGYLIYQIYKLLQGSIAFNILIGVVLLYLAWWLVSALKMDLLTVLLNQFVNVGVIILIIIFQPEVRRFLLLLGNNTLRQRSHFLRRLLDRNLTQPQQARQQYLREIKGALIRMSQRRWGALIVFSKNLNMEAIVHTGVRMDALISQPLIESVFNKEGPLHDGAVILTDNKIQAACCILPLSDNPDLPQSAGLRHRAGVGITERMAVATFIVSEETGAISFAYEGRLTENLQEADLDDLLGEHMI